MSDELLRLTGHQLIELLLLAIEILQLRSTIMWRSRACQSPSQAANAVLTTHDFASPTTVAGHEVAIPDQSGVLGRIIGMHESRLHGLRETLGEVLAVDSGASSHRR
ncbi:hypothetical protein [Halomonas sp. B23F22_10]|uniref:hypothetical protein n=1 Tax=Halomonas sp. B23F22_10 TaxID=3459515 RepID=UPI00373DF4A9